MTRRRMVIELVNAYADGVTTGRNATAVVQVQPDPPEESTLLSDLFRLTDEIAALLVPVDPSPQFVRRLGQSLAAAAEPAEIIIAQSSNRKLWIGALLSGSLVSALGVLAVLWFRRGRHSAAPAA